MKQKEKSILALCLVFAFLLTGKLFVFPKKSAQPETVPYQPGVNESTALAPAETTTLPESTQGIIQTTFTEPQPEQTGMSQSGTTAAAVTTTEAETTASQTTTASRPYSANGSPFFTLPASTAASTLVSGSETTVTTAAVTVPETTAASTVSETTAAPAPVGNGFTHAPEGYFNDALFIGDSRTVGQASYAPITGASFFATVGMSTANIYGSKSEVDPTKGMTFDGVMAAKQYGKVYIMLGINELGNDRTATLNNFSALLEKIKTLQPDAIIYIEANLHVTAARSQQNVYGVNNEQINMYNKSLSEFADNDRVYYIDVNPVFDDQSGALAADYTRDGVHPIASNYPTWADWLKEHAIVK